MMVVFVVYMWTVRYLEVHIWCYMTTVTVPTECVTGTVTVVEIDASHAGGCVTVTVLVIVQGVVGDIGFPPDELRSETPPEIPGCFRRRMVIWYHLDTIEATQSLMIRFNTIILEAKLCGGIRAWGAGTCPDDSDSFGLRC